MDSCPPSLSPSLSPTPTPGHPCPPGTPLSPPAHVGVPGGIDPPPNQLGGLQNVPAPAGPGVSPELRAPSLRALPEPLPGGHGGRGSGGPTAVPGGPGAVLGGRGDPRARGSRCPGFLGGRCPEVSVPGGPWAVSTRGCWCPEGHVPGGAGIGGLGGLPGVSGVPRCPGMSLYGGAPGVGGPSDRESRGVSVPRGPSVVGFGE